MIITNLKKAAAIAIMLFAGQSTYSQTPKPVDPKLYATIAALDSAAFDAYNKCDMVKFESFFADDVEFYHDNGGLMTDRKAIIESTKKYICGKVARQLVKESLEVYPINGYGAIEVGSHRFKNYGEGETAFGQAANFLNIWQLKDGIWKITRVVSYNHH